MNRLYLKPYLKLKTILRKYTKYLNRQFAFYCKLHLNYHRLMKTFFSLILFTFLLSCSGNSNDDRNCRFLLDIGVNRQIDLNLFPFTELLFPGNSVYVPNEGNAGIIISTTTGKDFYAWDAADPNHQQSSCSVLAPEGLFATCGCEDANKYELVNGTAVGQNDLRCALRNIKGEKAWLVLY